MEDEMGGTFLRVGVLSCLRKGYEVGLLNTEPPCNMERTDIFRPLVTSSEEQDNEGEKPPPPSCFHLFKKIIFF